MAPLPEIADTYRVCFRWNQDNVCNVLHFHGSGGTVDGLANAIAANVSSAMWNVVANFLKVVELEITPLFDDAATYSYFTDGTAKWTGTVASGESIPAVAAVVSLHTAFRGPANRGRVYVGPVAEQATSFGTLDDSRRTAMVTAWGNFGSGLISDDYQHVVASYVHGTALTVTNYSIRSACGTMRRRQDRKAA